MLDVREVTGSSPVSSTKKRLVFVEIRGVFLVFFAVFQAKKLSAKFHTPSRTPNSFVSEIWVITKFQLFS